MKYNILKLAGLLACFTCLASTAGNAGTTSNYQEDTHTPTFGSTSAASAAGSVSTDTHAASAEVVGAQSGNHAVLAAGGEISGPRTTEHGAEVVHAGLNGITHEAEEGGSYTSTSGNTHAAYEGESETGHTGYAEGGAAGVQHGNSGIAVAEAHGEGLTGHADSGVVGAQHGSHAMVAGAGEVSGIRTTESAAGVAHTGPYGSSHESESEGTYSSLSGNTHAGYESASESGLTGHPAEGIVAGEDKNTSVVAIGAEGSEDGDKASGGLVVAEHKGEVSAVGGGDLSEGKVNESASGEAHLDSDDNVSWEGGQDGSAPLSEM